MIHYALLEKATIHRRAPKGGVTSYKGGQFLPSALWEQEKQKGRQALPVLLDRFGERLQLLRAVYEQNHALEKEGITHVKLLPLTTLEAQMKSAVRDAYEEAFLAGKRASGNLTSTTETERKAIQALRIDEFRYLRKFLEDMREGRGRMDYSQRADYYKAAARELFHLGFVLGNQSEDRKIEWRLGPTEHCETCCKAAGVYKVGEFIRNVLSRGILPQSGRLDCLGYHCQCRLEEVRLNVSA